MAQSFAFARERKTDPIDPQPEHPSFNITSFAFVTHGNDGDVPFDELTALFDRPAEFPFQHIRHLTFSIGPQDNFSFPEQEYVEDFMARLADLLSNWTALETFNFHFNLNGRKWRHTYSEGYVPVLDDTTVPTEHAGEAEPTLRYILMDRSPIEIYEAIREISRILGHAITIDDEGIELDLIWLDRNEHIVTKGVRALAEKCRKLRAFRWFVDLSSDNPSTQWAYEIGRDKDGKVQDVQVQTSCLMSRKKTLLEFKVLVGQELQTVVEAWPARHDEYIW
ncbi:hypothetical protein K525DRAFT_194032 [Schizophyllum commune Loenen D]|nr:hypothetical protein K525DRAFT_194032 [Schizophyllum commune Loenen D]